MIALPLVHSIKALDLLVNAGVLLDERIGAGDVGLRLIIIEVTDEIFDGVAGEKAFELGVKLRGQRFVVGNDQGRFVHVFDDVRDRERFARTGHTEQRLMFGAGQNAFRQPGNRLGLIAGGLIRRDELEHRRRS